MGGFFPTMLWAAAVALVGLVSHYTITIALRPRFSQLKHLPGPKVN